MNNLVFSKPMEDVTNLTTKDEARNYLVSETNYHITKQFF